LQYSVEKYKKRYRHYPKEVLVDKIYCTRINRAHRKELEIILKAKPLGRPLKKALSNQVIPEKETQSKENLVKQKQLTDSIE
jgi:hypothetical protein